MKLDKLRTCVVPRAFSLIELLASIAIIGILSAIVLASLNTARNRAMDARRMQDVDTIIKALAMYHADHGNFIEEGSGCGYAGNGYGWFNANTGASYTKSIAQCLIDGGYLPQEIIDPTGARTAGAGDRNHTYMKHTCIQNGQKVTYVYASLATRPRFEEAPTATDGTCHSGFDLSYGMNYWKKI